MTAEHSRSIEGPVTFIYMRIVAQRVTHASVTIDGKVKSEIGLGMMVLLGIEEADNEEDVDWLCTKLAALYFAA